MSGTRLVHLSDLHFGRVDAAVVQALIAEIRALAPDLVVVSGDLTMAARRAEFRAARAFLDALGTPWLAVPGNHDISPYHLLQRFLDPFRRWRRFIGPDIEPVWSNGQAMVIGLNSARAAGWSLDWSAGRLNREQLERLATRVGTATAPIRIVVTHHPVVAPEDTRRSGVLGRAALALRFFRAHGIGLVLAGHLHRSFRQHVTAGAWVTNAMAVKSEARASEALASEARVSEARAELEKAAETVATAGMVVLLAGSATSTRLRDEPNSFYVIGIQPDGLLIERRIWTGAGWQQDGLAHRDAPVLDAPGHGQLATG